MQKICRWALYALLLCAIPAVAQINGGSVINGRPKAPIVCAILATAGTTTCSNGQILGNAGVFSTPAGALYLTVELIGGGGGGGGSGVTTTAGVGGTGGNTTFGTALLTGSGGPGGVGTGGAPTNGGAASGGYLNVSGQPGGQGTGNSTFGPGGGGGIGPYGNRGYMSTCCNIFATVTAYGSGGSGGYTSGTGDPGTGGNSAGFVRAILPSPLATYAYTVGAAGTAGTAGTSGNAGQPGVIGYITVTVYFQ